MRRFAGSLLATIVAIAIGGVAAAQTDGDDGLSSDGFMPLGSAVLGEMAQVVEVVDGVTLKVDRGQGVETVRYIGIDVPESVRPDEGSGRLGPRATAINQALVGDRWVILESDTSDTDQQGRLLRYVWAPIAEGLLLVNNELVRRGLAQSRAAPPDTWYQGLLDQTQAEAMANGVGRYATTPNSDSTPQPTLAPGERTLKPYDETISYRWLDASEYECSSQYGCWGLLVQPATACTRSLRVKVVLREQDSEEAEDVWKIRKGVKAGDNVKFRIDAPEGGARTAAIAKIRCTQKP